MTVTAFIEGLGSDNSVAVDVYDDAIELQVSQGGGRYAEIMLEENEARQLAAALLTPWDKS